MSRLNYRLVSGIVQRAQASSREKEASGRLEVVYLAVIYLTSTWISLKEKKKKEQKQEVVPNAYRVNRWLFNRKVQPRQKWMFVGTKKNKNLSVNPMGGLGVVLGGGASPADDQKGVNSVEVVPGGLKAMQLTENRLQVTLTHALSKTKHALGISGGTKYKYATLFFFRSTNLLNISDNEQSIFNAPFPNKLMSKWTQLNEKE